MSDQNPSGVNYQEVVKAAQSLLNKGERYTVEKIRRMIGNGTHVQIAEVLRKWQNSKRNKPKSAKQQNPAQKGEGSPRQQRHKFNKNKPHDNRRNTRRKPMPIQLDQGESYEIFRSSEPFSKEKLAIENPLVQSLFWAIHEVREQKSSILEDYRQSKSALAHLRHEVDQSVMAIKKRGREDVRKLSEELARLKTVRDMEIEGIRKALLS